MPIRILYLVRSYAIGGVQGIIQLLLRHLRGEGFRIITIPYDSGSEHDQTFVDSLLRQGHEVAPERIPWRGPRDWFRARRVIGDLVRKYEIDIVHSHDDQSNMLVGIGRKPRPCARVASAYGWFESGLKLKVHYAIERRLALPHFDYVYTVSQDMKKKLVVSGTDPGRVRVIHTGVDVGRFASRGLRSAVRMRLGLPQDAVVVGTVSRLSAEKGHRFLLQATQMLLRTHPRLAVLCVGTGHERDRLEAQSEQLGLADRVYLPGFYEDLPGVLEAMDIFALPSILEEGFPTSSLEAQAAGLPIVASDVGGTRETINAGVSGLLVRPADPHALAQALGELAADHERRLKMGASARQWISDSFSLPGMMSQMADLYRHAFSHRSNRSSSAPHA